MKKENLTLFLLFLCSIAFSQNKETSKETITSKNEIKVAMLVNTGGPHYALAYERQWNQKLSVGFFAKKNFIELLPTDDFVLENYGFGIQSRWYLNNYHIPAFLNGYAKKGILVRLFSEFFMEYIQGEKYKTQRKLNKDSIYTITRDKINFNATSINLGIGTKYAFYKIITIQVNAGLSKYFPKNSDLDFGGYFNLSVGFLF